MVSPRITFSFILPILILLLPIEEAIAQCPQNNLTVENIYFFDSEGNPFGDNVEYEAGTLIDGQIFVKFGGSASNSYSLYFAYDLIINDQLIDRVELCLFEGQNVPQDKPVKITDFTLRWGDKIEFGNVFMRWQTNQNTTCPSASGSNAQCFSNPGTFMVNTPFIPMPVIWKDYNVFFDLTQNNISVNWSTEKEWESSHFEIERSAQGIDKFEKIAEVKSVGWSDTLTQYSYTDHQLPYGGGRLYYRVKQVDFDGSMDYSPTQMVQIPKVMSNKNHWQAIPNPVINKELQLTYSGPPLQKEAKVRIYTPSSSYSYVFNNPGNTIDLGPILHKLPKGILIVEIISETNTERLKVIKK
jgi:hypothetical protein